MEIAPADAGVGGGERCADAAVPGDVVVAGVVGVGASPERWGILRQRLHGVLDRLRLRLRG